MGVRDVEIEWRNKEEINGIRKNLIDKKNTDKKKHITDFAKRFS